LARRVIAVMKRPPALEDDRLTMVPRRRRFWLGALIALAASTTAWAAAPVEPWPQTQSDLPADPAIRFGVLPNGLRYAIMRNATPKAEVSIRFRIGAGSLMETDAQAGLAHMVEHMSFRGTTHVPQAEEWKGLQRLGMAMGADVSAFTSDTMTFYQFDLPRADLATLDSGLMRMRETASEILMRPDALEAERGTVLSEMRTRDTPGYRTSRAELAFFYHGQPLATRAPIGTVDNIQHAPAAALKAFYHAFYRPELATLIVVGDIDPDLVEARIKAHFGDWAPVGPPGARPDLGTPAPRGFETRLIIDPKLARAIVVGWVSPYDATPHSIANVRRNLIENIAIAVMNHRLQRLASRPDRPFLSAQLFRQDQARSARLVALSVDVDPPHWNVALTAAETARRQAVEFGVRQDEVDREVASFLANYQAAADSAATRPTPALAGSLLASADNATVFTSPQENLDLVKQATQGLTAAQVTETLRSLFKGGGPLLFMSSPIPVKGGQESVAAAFKAAEIKPITALAAEADLSWPYADFGVPGAVAARQEIADLGVTFVRFANGVRLTVKPTDFSADQVLVTAKVGQGLLQLPSDRGTARWADDAGAFILGGLKAISYEDMQQVLASKVYGVGFGARDDGFVLTGGATSRDLDTQLQVLAAYVTAPGWRAEAFDRVRAGAAPQLNNLAASPNGVMSRDIGGLLHNGDPRWATVTPIDLTFTKLSDAQAVIADALAKGSIEVTIVGDVTVDRAIAAVAATFGALPARPDPSPPAPEALRVRFPAPTATPVVRHHKGRSDQALALIAWPAPDFYSDPQRSRDMRILEQIIQARLFDQLRIGAGASYVPQTALETSTTFPGYGYVEAAAEVPPDKIDLFYRIVGRITDDLKAHEVTQDELDRAKQPRVDLFTKSQQTNGYWLNVLTGAQSDPRKLDVIRTTIPDLKHVTAPDVRKAARLVLDDAKAWKMEVLPLETGAPAPPPVNGTVLVDCALDGDRLGDCHVLREDPAGRGLGVAAVAYAGKLTPTPKILARAKDGRVQFAITLPYPDPSA
jgi:zinc protease